jgi:hypothetical protein
MTFSDAQVLASALYLLNAKPRFGPLDRRLAFDSYSVAADIEKLLRRAGYEPMHPSLLPRND